MKFTPEVLAALATLRANVENDFERHRIDVLERDLTAPPVVEQVDENHQRVNGITFYRNKSGHYRWGSPNRRNCPIFEACYAIKCLCFTSPVL